MSKSAIPSPARSQGTAVPRRHKPRRTLSTASPARSDTSAKLMSVVEPFINNDMYSLSPMKRRSVLPDDTEIEAPRRASWWKRLEGSSRDILEALDTNQMQGDLLLEEFEVEVEKEKQSQSVPESSDNESVASIVVPQRRLFNQKKQSQGKFGEIMGSRKSLGGTNLEDHDITINYVPKNLFNKDKTRNRPVFPSALLNSTNKTINKTVEPDVNEPKRRNLFGQAATKRKKNLFTDFVMSESEDDSEIQHKVFGFKKNDNKRISLAALNRRTPSLTPSVTAEIDIDDWKLLPSSTMIGNGSGALEVSRITNDEEIIQMEVENQDVTLTEANQSIKLKNNNHNTSKSLKSQSFNRNTLSKSKKYDDEYDKTLTDENIEVEQASKSQDLKVISDSSNINKSQRRNRTMPSGSRKDQTLETETTKTDKEALKENKTLVQSRNNEQKNNINDQTTDIEACVEDKMAELHGVYENKEKSDQDENPTMEQEMPSSAKETVDENQDDDMEEMVWNDDDKANEDDNENNKSNKSDSARDETNEHISQENEHDSEESEDDNLSEHAAESTDVDNEAKDMENERDLDEASDDNDQKRVDSLGEEKQIEQENDVEETSNSSYATTDRNKKKDESQVKSPEAVLQNMSKDNMSFKPIGRSTSFRKSAIKDINLKRIQESTIGSEGSRTSSTEGSGWDSHRTTRKTLRQTFGKDFTPRKSLRTLVMEKSAKRQTDVDKNASKVNNTKNKTVLEDQHMRDRRMSNRNLTSNQLSHSKSPAVDVSAPHLPDPLISKVLNQEELINITDKVYYDSFPEISIHASYGCGMSRDNSQPDNRVSDQAQSHEMHKSNASGMKDASSPDKRVSDQAESRDMHESNDSGMKDASRPDKSVSYEAESRDMHESNNSGMKDASRPDKSVSYEAESRDMHESNGSGMKDASSPDKRVSDQADEDSDQDDSQDIHDSNGSGMSRDASRQDDGDSDQEESHDVNELYGPEMSKDATLPDNRDSDLDESRDMNESNGSGIMDASHPDNGDSDQDDDGSDQDESHDIHESNGSVMSRDTSRQDDGDSDQEKSHDVNELYSSEMSKDAPHPDNSDSDQDESRDRNESNGSGMMDASHPDNADSDQDDEDLDQDESHDMQESIDSGVARDVSRQDDEDSGQDENDDIHASYGSGMSNEAFHQDNRESDQDESHDVSAGTKKSLMVIQMEKIVQENMEMRRKIREKVQNSLKLKRDCNKFMFPISISQSKHSIRRIKKPEPIKPTRKPRKTTALLMGALPKEFTEDLTYKPPKRFQPANASWITKRLYKFLESKLEPKYDYRARVRAEQLVQNIYAFAKLARRRDVAPQAAVDELKREMARLNVVTTHFEFYEFFHQFMPREIRVKVNPDIVNKIPMPRNGVFSDILEQRPTVD